MAKRRTTRKSLKVKTTTHGDKRVNIPTQELSDFIAAEQRQPKTLLYLRDPGSVRNRSGRGRMGSMKG